MEGTRDDARAVAVEEGRKRWLLIDVSGVKRDEKLGVLKRERVTGVI
jgi:hypothetical protein